jgi:hypothetical protein
MELGKSNKEDKEEVGSRQKEKKALKMVCYQMAMNAFTLGGLTLQIMFFNNMFFWMTDFLSCLLALRKVLMGVASSG